MLYDQEAVVVFLQDGHELKDGKGAAHFLGSEAAIKSAQNTSIVALPQI
jgi:hypothetical protein